jgi:hypothetical protein
MLSETSGDFVVPEHKITNNLSVFVFLLLWDQDLKRHRPARRGSVPYALFTICARKFRFQHELSFRTVDLIVKLS